MQVGPLFGDLHAVSVNRHQYLVARRAPCFGQNVAPCSTTNGGGVGSAIAASSKEICLRFSEGGELRVSSITLADGRNSAQTPNSAAAVADPNDRKTLILELRGLLRSGPYWADWKVDSHKTTGTFTFVVKP
jgi:methionine-rich copper-binding protein CopC